MPSRLPRMNQSHARQRSLILGRRSSTQACCVREPCRAGCGRSVHYTRALHRRKAFLLRRAAVMGHASYGLPESALLLYGTRKRATTLAVSREEAQHASLLRARAMPRWLWSLYALSKATAPARSLSPSTRGRGATCQLLPPRDRISRLSRGTCERATALAVSGEKTQHAGLLRARAVPRSLWSVHALGKATAQARVLSPSARGSGRTCQLLPPIISRLSHGTRKRATALAVSRQEVQHTSELRACTVPH